MFSGLLNTGSSYLLAQRKYMQASVLYAANYKLFARNLEVRLLFCEIYDTIGYNLVTTRNEEL